MALAVPYRVAARSSFAGVPAVAAVHGALAVETLEGVIAGPTEQRVVACATDYPVGAGKAVEAVGAGDPRKMSGAGGAGLSAPTAKIVVAVVVSTSAGALVTRRDHVRCADTVRLRADETEALVWNEVSAILGENRSDS